MSVSDEECREIAAKLRGSRDFARCIPKFFMPQNDLFERVLKCVRFDGGNVFDRLADLIDRPTAKKEHNGAYWRCTHCGAFTRKDAVVVDGLGVVPLRCCGNCGREWG